MAANPTNNHDWKAKYEISDRDRFELELEFVECLANPEYLNWLAQTQLFNDPDFIKFLNYLKYWQQPEYSHFITFPHCLYMLEQVQKPDFRKALIRKDVQIAIAWQQDYFFRHFRKNRLKQQAQARQQAAGKLQAAPEGTMERRDKSSN